MAPQPILLAFVIPGPAVPAARVVVGFYKDSRTALAIRQVVLPQANA